MEQFEEKDLIKLRQQVELVVHRKMVTPYDFEYLSDTILMRCQSKLSQTTLKRLWGYCKNPHRPFKSTLNLLSKFIGYKDFDDFVSKKDENTPSSFIHAASFISDKDLEIGDMVWISWAPNRQCMLTYQGDHSFVVSAAHNTKLHVGDSFSSMHFAEGMPLFLDNYIHKNNPPTTFVVGFNGGMSSIRIITPSELECHAIRMSRKSNNPKPQKKAKTQKKGKNPDQ